LAPFCSILFADQPKEDALLVCLVFGFETEGNKGNEFVGQAFPACQQPLNV
jgi:hypothetical protein